jgi:hypothetical protein
MSTYTPTSSSELMENYVQSDILQPQLAFCALQTDTGASLLFSIDTDNAFYVTMELPGASSGWSRANLSGARAAQDFPTGATCTTFAAAQTVAAQGAAIHLAMVLDDGINDHLYLSLGNSDTDTSWTDAPAWVPCPFNATDGAGNPLTPPSPLKVAGVMISEATDQEYIVVDIIANPTEPVGLLSRFYIDVSNPANPVWMPHDISIDVDASSYQSCLGRTSQRFAVDGLYTMGTIDSAPQLIFAPLFNAIDPSVPPSSSRLMLPGGLTAEAIAACRNADNTSDLYVAAQGGLYYFASTNQTDQAVGVLLGSYDLLNGVRDLFAYAADGNVTVWGLNGNDAVFYLTCPQAQITTAGAWNLPLTILSGVDAISPYIDRQYSANTFFAHNADGLIKAIKTPSTGLWNHRNITLPPSEVMQDAYRIASYTTRIQVNDANGQPAPNVTVALTATAVTSIMINHLYYMVGPAAIEVATDAFGSITIVELTQTLAGTRFTATVDGQTLAINPMDAPFQRSSGYDTVDKLQTAHITNQDGSTQSFIPPGTSTQDLQGVAQSNQNLATAYASLNASSGGSTSPAGTASGVSGLLHESDGIQADLGDLFRWLESGIDSVISIVKDAVNDVWHFVATIGDQMYYGILDCVEKVVAAATWVYNAIKIAVADVVKFLEFLFSWPDILVTHRVLKTVFTCFVQNVIDALTNVEADLPSLFQQLQTDIDNWVDIPNFNQTPGGTLTGNPPLPGQNSAPANTGVHHFQGNCANSQSGCEALTSPEAIFNDLLGLLQSEGATLQGAYEAIKTDIIDQFASLSLTDIIKKFLAIVVDTLLQTAQNILIAVVKVLIQLTSGTMTLLTTTLNIPVISWLYNDLTGATLSFLDVICLIAAIPVTIVYKASANAAPFPSDDPFTVGLLAATTFAEVEAQFVTTTGPSGLATARPATLAASGPAPVLDQSRLKVFGFTAGVTAMIGSVALAVTSTIQKTLDMVSANPFPKTLAAIAAVCNVAYVSPNIATLINAKTDTWYSQVNNAVTAISLVKGFGAIPFAATENKAIPMAFATTETLINIIWNIPVVANIVVNHANFDTTYKSLIPESIGNFAFNFGGILELPIALINTPVAKITMILVQDGLMMTYGVLMVVAGGIYEWAPGQSH